MSEYEMYEIDVIVNVDELGEGRVTGESYMHIGDVLVIPVAFPCLPDDYVPQFGSGIGCVGNEDEIHVAIYEILSS
jgi:hypothetical protein